MSQVKTFIRHFNDNVLLKVSWYGQEAGGPRHVVVPWSHGLINPLSAHTSVGHWLVAQPPWVSGFLSVKAG